MNENSLFKSIKRLLVFCKMNLGSSDLVYDKHTGELIGFADLDKVGNDLMNIQKVLKDEKVLARYVLIVMVIPKISFRTFCQCWNYCRPALSNLMESSGDM